MRVFFFSGLDSSCRNDAARLYARLLGSWLRIPTACTQFDAELGRQRRKLSRVKSFRILLSGTIADSLIQLTNPRCTFRCMDHLRRYVA